MDSYPLRRSNPATDPWLLPRTVSQRTSPATAYARVIVSPYGCRAGSRPRSRCSPAPATATSAFPPRAVPFPIAATFVSLALAAGHHRCSYRNRSYIPGGRRPAAPSVAYNGHHAPVSGQGEAAERLAAVRQRAPAASRAVAWRSFQVPTMDCIRFSPGESICRGYGRREYPAHIARPNGCVNRERDQFWIVCSRQRSGAHPILSA